MSDERRVDPTNWPYPLEPDEDCGWLDWLFLVGVGAAVMCALSGCGLDGLRGTGL